MASVGGNTTQFGFGGFTNNNLFGIPNTSTTGGLFSFGVPTSFSGSTSSSTSMFGTRPTTTNNSFTTTTSPFSGSTSSSSTSMFGTTTNNSFTTTTSPFSSATQPSNSFTTTSPFGTGLTTTNSFTTTSSFFKPITNSFTNPPPPPYGIGPFSTGGQSTTSTTTTSPFSTPFAQPNYSWTTSPFGQTTTTSTTSPFTATPPARPFGQTTTTSTTSPFTTTPPARPFGQPNNSWTTSPFTTTQPAPLSPFTQTNITTTTSPFTIRPPPNPFNKTTNPSPPFTPAPFPTTNFPFTSSTVSTPTTSPSSVSVFAPPFSTTSIQGTRQKGYNPTAFKEGPNAPLCKIESISAMPVYQNKSHEELRLEDYTLTGKAGTTSTTSTTTITPNTQTIFPQPVINPFTTTLPKLDNPFTTTLPKLDNPFTTTVPKLDNPFTTTLPKWDNPFTTILPKSDNPFTTTLPKSDNPFTTTLPKSTTTTTTPPNMLPISPQPVITPFSTTSQTISTTVPNSATSVPVSPMPNPFATEVRDTLPIIKPFQYGISCLPVRYENPKPAQKMPQVNVRQLSMGRRRVPIEKYKPIEVEKRVPFFEELPGMYKKGSAVLMPRENPRSWVALSCQEQRLDTELSELSVSDHSTDLCNNKTEDSSQVDECVPKTQQNTDAIISNDHKDILAMIPKLRSPEYYMEPSTEDLAANELKRPGFCCKVKDFMIGRRDYGNIKFLGETDVRNLDVESIVQFANREVEVYKDEKDKPAVGQGLNKAAEITLLNIKCIDKSTGMHYTDGPRVDKYKELLMRKAMKQGSEFVSYDPVKGEWRFKVEHF